MDINNMLIDYLNKKYGKEAINVISKNSLYYILGDKYVEFDDADISSIKRRRAIMMLNQNTLLNISDVFCNNEIDYISFKGVILSNYLYNNSISRNAGDIDIFVFEKDYDRAYQILLEKGYKLKYENGYKNQHHVVLKNNTSIIELHRNLYHPAINIDETYLRNHIEVMRISNKLLYTFDTTATLLHLIYHLYMDCWLESGNMYYYLTQKRFPKVGRFLYRAYEIALFSSKYYDKINWTDIQNDFLHQKLRVIFKKMISDIDNIFTTVFPQSLMETVFSMEYVDDHRDQLYKYCMEKKLEQNDNNIECVLCSYIEENWQERREKNINVKIGESITLFNAEQEGSTQELRCIVNTKRIPTGIELSFMITNDDFCFSEENDYDTQATDGVHLLLCSTDKYSYNSIFFFPKRINGAIKIVVCDVINNKYTVINDKLLKADFTELENGYAITAILSNEFIENNNMISFFYMGLVISDCSIETRRRKNQLILSEDESQWYNPIYFAKVELD